MQGLHVASNRKYAAAVLTRPPQEWDVNEKLAVRALATSLGEAANIRREQVLASCVDGYKEALYLLERSGDGPAAAICAFNLGQTYGNLTAILDLDIAEGWYRRSLELQQAEDNMARAGCFLQLGSVAYQRFVSARASRRLSEEIFGYLSLAGRYYHQALELCPSEAVQELAATYNQLGTVYAEAGQLSQAVTYFQESVRYKEVMRDRFAAGGTRHNVGTILAAASVSRRLANGLSRPCGTLRLATMRTKM